jgi:hypothetical protein
MDGRLTTRRLVILIGGYTGPVTPISCIYSVYLEYMECKDGTGRTCRYHLWVG